MAHEIKFSLQHHAFDEHVRPKSLDWVDMVEMLYATMPVQADKSKSMAITPAIFDNAGPGYRKNENVVAVTCLTIDLDKGLTQAKLDALRAKLCSMGVAYVLHFTNSCHEAYTAKQEYKVRAVLPLAEPVPASEWLAFWEKARVYFGDWQWDIHCKNTARLYYLPSAASREGQAWMLDHHGPDNPWLQYDVKSPFLDPDVIRAMSAPLSVIKSTPITSTPLPAIVADLRARLRTMKTEPHKHAMAMALEAVLDGQEYSVEGDRNPTMSRLGNFLAHRYPHQDPHKLALLFERSQDLMAATHSVPPDSLEKIADNIRRAQAKVHTDIALKIATVTSRESRIIYAATGQHDPEYRYTAEDKRQMALELGVSDDALEDHYIMMHPSNKEFFILTKNGLLKFTKGREIYNAVYKLLLPTGIPLEVPRGNKNNPTMQPRPMEDVIKTNGSVPSKVAFDNRIKTHRLTEDKTLLLPCPRSHLTAKHSPVVEQFLRILFGDHYEKLVQWLAWFPETTEAIAALVLQGEARTGKTLLATGLAKIWAYRTPVAFETAIDKFNYDLVNMPLIFADERLPSDHSVDKYLREFVTTREFFVQQKGMPIYPCYGYRRLIIASNSPQITNGDKQDLTLSDLNALKERMWEVTGNIEARAYLTALKPGQYDAMLEHEIAEHVLYLNEHEKGPRINGRLAVSGSGDVGTHIVLSDRPVLMIFQMLTTVMDKFREGKDKHDDMLGYKWGNGKVAINNEGVTKNPVWESVAGKYKPAWTSPGKHLRKASEDDLRTKLFFRGVKKHCYRINTDLFYAYLDEHQGVDVDIYRDMINGAPQGE